MDPKRELKKLYLMAFQENDISSCIKIVKMLFDVEIKTNPSEPKEFSQQDLKVFLKKLKKK